MPKQTFGEQLWNGLADAVADVREKCVEEAWFGRVVNERGPLPEPSTMQEPFSSTRTIEREPELDLEP